MFLPLLCLCILEILMIVFTLYFALILLKSCLFCHVITIKFIYIILLYVSVSILFDRHFIRLLFRVLVYFKIFTVDDFVQSQLELFFV